MLMTLFTIDVCRVCCPDPESSREPIPPTLRMFVVVTRMFVFFVTFQKTVTTRMCNESRVFLRFAGLVKVTRIRHRSNATMFYASFVNFASKSGHNRRFITSTTPELRHTPGVSHQNLKSVQQNSLKSSKSPLKLKLRHSDASRTELTVCHCEVHRRKTLSFVTSRQRPPTSRDIIFRLLAELLSRCARMTQLRPILTEELQRKSSTSESTESLWRLLL
jgi:hypothetical protein